MWNSWQFSHTLELKYIDKQLVPTQTTYRSVHLYMMKHIQIENVYYYQDAVI